MRLLSHSLVSRSDVPSTCLRGSLQHLTANVPKPSSSSDEGFESLEEDFAEEQFFAAIRASYWKEAEGSSTRTVVAALIETLEF